MSSCPDLKIKADCAVCRLARHSFRVALIVFTLTLHTAPPVFAQTAPTTPPATPEKRLETTAAAAGESGKPRRAEDGARGSLTGRVVSEDGQPIASAAVNLYAPGATFRAPNSTTADEEGKFRFDNLEPAAYHINAFSPGYVSMPDPTLERGSRVYHRAGEFVTLTLAKGGVITGTVTNASGEPVVNVRVRTTFVRALDPSSNILFGGGGEQPTDDRGVYRIYGLAVGIYVVSAGGNARPFGPLPSAYDSDSPTYFPSQTRDGASEISVRLGQEAGGIDIRYRGEEGRTVSGTIGGVSDASNDFGISITLARASTGTVENSVFVSARGGDNTFSFDGVADGDYDITARRSSRDGDLQASAPRRVSVRGADVTGLSLSMFPLASVSGRVRIEAAATTNTATTKNECEERRGANLLPQEVAVVLRRDLHGLPKDAARPRVFSRRDTLPDAQGDFAFRGLDAGRYRLEAIPADPNWYVYAVSIPATNPEPAASSTRAVGGGGRRAGATPSHASATPTPNARTSPAGVVSRDSFTLEQGKNFSNLQISVAHGAASLRGLIIPREEGAVIPEINLMRAHLIPVERERADDPLNFYESRVAGDGSFAFMRLAPGRYWIIASLSRGNEKEDELSHPVAWEAGGRARLRRDAEAANVLVELGQCRSVEGFVLPYGPANK